MTRFMMRLGAGFILVASLAGCGGFGGGGSGGTKLAATTTAPATSSSGGQTTPAATIPANVTLRQLVVETDRLSISQPGFGQQLQASGVFSDGRVRDLTHLVQWTAQDPSVAKIDAKGVAAPLAAGTTGIEAAWSGLTAMATLEVKASALPASSGTTTPPPPAAAAPTWHADVFPLFATTLSCKGCHNATGPGRMKLTLDEQTDYTAFTTGGLIDTKNPAGSLVLEKGCGLVSHGGGAAMKASGPEATKIQAWIAAGAPRTASSTPAPPVALPSSLPAPDVLIVNPGERNLVDPNATQQLVVLAFWSATGLTADVTRSALYALSSGVASVDSDAVLTASGAGSVTLTVSFNGKTAQAQLALGARAALANGDQPSLIALPTPTGTATPGTMPPPPPPSTTPPPPATLTYTANVASIMNVSCVSCHDGRNEFSLKTYTAVVGECRPGDSSRSNLIQETKSGGKMARYITATDFNTLKLWVDQGCKQ